jgi:hypothetical protein
MRPRFSLKWLLIAFTILGVAFYVAFVRPTAQANRFIESLKAAEYTTLPSDLVPNDEMLRTRKWKFKDARLESREWADVWRCRRRFSILLSREPPFINTVIVDLAAGPSHFEVNRIVHGGSSFE